MSRYERERRGFLATGPLAAVLLLAAAALRVFFVFATRADPVFRVPYLDGAFYHTWAKSLAAGRGDFVGPYFLGPLYPYALSAVYRLAAPEPLAARIFQTGFGILDIVLVWLVGKRLFGRIAACAAAALLALHGTLVFYEGLLLMESLLLTLVLGAVAILVCAPWPRTCCAGVAGFLLGAATLGRGTVLLAAPVILWCITRRSGVSRVRRRAALLPVIVCCVAWLLVLLPVLIRNTQLGAFGLTTNGGVNFYAGNSPHGNGRFRQPPGVRFFTGVPPALDATTSLPTALAARPLTIESVAGTAEAADTSLWLARAWDGICGDWLAFARLLLRKVGLTLQAREIPQIESFAFHADRLPILRAFFIDLSVILPLAALGAWRLWRKKWGPGGETDRSLQRCVVGLAVACLLPCVLFFVTARYRLSAVPYLVLLAGAGIDLLVGWWRRSQSQALVVASVFLVILGAGTRLGARPPRGAAAWEKAQMAERVYALGDLEATIRYQEAAARELPQRSEILLNLALYYSERENPGDLGRAEEIVMRLLANAPSDALLHFNLGTILERQQQWSSSRQAFERALRLDPTLQRARESLRALDAKTGT